MSERRERHGRGWRGSLARPGSPARLAERRSGEEVFARAVRTAMDMIGRSHPELLVDVLVGIEQVPTSLVDHKMPLASAKGPTEAAPGFVMLYRRPIERRAEEAGDLLALVAETLVEQLAAVAGVDPDDL